MKFSRILYFLILFSLFCFLSCNGDKGDTSPPELTIISPGNGSVVNEIVSINVNALDNEEIDFVHFFVSDSVDSMIISSEPYVFYWNTNGLDDGDYINVQMDGAHAKLLELSTRNELKQQPAGDTGLVKKDALEKIKDGLEATKENTE